MKIVYKVVRKCDQKWCKSIMPVVRTQDICRKYLPLAWARNFFHWRRKFVWSKRRKLSTLGRRQSGQWRLSARTWWGQTSCSTSSWWRSETHAKTSQKNRWNNPRGGSSSASFWPCQRQACWCSTRDCCRCGTGSCPSTRLSSRQSTSPGADCTPSLKHCDNYKRTSLIRREAYDDTEMNFNSCCGTFGRSMEFDGENWASLFWFWPPILGDSKPNQVE